MNQNEAVLEYIKKNGEISTFDAFVDLGVSRLSARIYDLRNQGLDIFSEKRTIKKANGKKKQVSYYYLKNKKGCGNSPV